MAGGGANSGVGSGLSTAAGAVYVLGGLALGETGSGAVQGAIAAAAAPAAIAGQCWRAFCWSSWSRLFRRFASSVAAFSAHQAMCRSLARSLKRRPQLGHSTMPGGSDLLREPFPPPDSSSEFPSPSGTSSPLAAPIHLVHLPPKRRPLVGTNIEVNRTLISGASLIDCYTRGQGVRSAESSSGAGGCAEGNDCAGGDWGGGGGGGSASSSTVVILDGGGDEYMRQSLASKHNISSEH
ncbi:hypothetical protein TYRP_019237 [Tyrophagus putrescentiae]|nr:hypothetical protein TYRP_019237 [Tyrophagus putrescentiae]